MKNFKVEPNTNTMPSDKIVRIWKNKLKNEIDTKRWFENNQLVF